MRKLIPFLFIILLFLIIACNKNINMDKNYITNSFPSDVSINENITGNFNEFKWLNFSLTNFEDEKNIVKGYFVKEFNEIKQGIYGTDDIVKIAICMEDINSDGKKDIIALIFNSYFSGYNTNSLLCAFVTDKETTKYIPIAQAFIKIDEINSQEVIGVESDEKTEWKQFIVNGIKYKWDGTKYIINKDKSNNAKNTSIDHSSSFSSSASTHVATNTSSATQDIQDTGMNLKQIQAGNYSSLLGNWKEVAYAVNPHNGTGEQWKAGTLSTLSVSSDKIEDGNGNFVIQGNTLKDNAGSHTLSFENNGGSLVASLADENVAINWVVYFYPKGVINDIQPNNGVKIDNTKNLIVIWTSNNDFTEVFAQTNASKSVTSGMKKFTKKSGYNTLKYKPESKYPFIKITQIKKFYNNDYYGKILNYRINSDVVNGEKRYIVDYNVEYPQLYKIRNKSVIKKVNNQLKMILFQDVQEDDYDQILNDFSSIINKKKVGVEAAEGTCKIYLFDDDYISVGYKCNFFNGGTFLTVNRLLTINLSTGETVNLKDFVNTDSIVKNIKNLKFDIIEGSYTDGFGTGKEDKRISSFIEAFKESIKNNSTEFSIDNTYLYLNFQYDDSLDGYMLLRFKRNDLKQ